MFSLRQYFEDSEVTQLGFAINHMPAGQEFSVVKVYVYHLQSPFVDFYPIDIHRLGYLTLQSAVLTFCGQRQ